MSKHGLQVIENDALVVLVFNQPGAIKSRLTWWWVRKGLQELGFNFTKSKVHSMLSRAKGRVHQDNYSKEWYLTAAGVEYQRHVIQVLGLLEERSRRIES